MSLKLSFEIIALFKHGKDWSSFKPVLNPCAYFHGNTVAEPKLYFNTVHLKKSNSSRM